VRDRALQIVQSNALIYKCRHLGGLAAREWGTSRIQRRRFSLERLEPQDDVIMRCRRQHEKVAIAQLSDPTMPFEEMRRVIVKQLGTIRGQG